MIAHLEELVEAARKNGRKTIAVAAAHDREVIHAIVMAYEAGIADAVLVGHKKEITEMLEESGQNPADYQIVEAGSDSECAERAVELIREGRTQFLMKGMLGTADMMRAVVNKEHGIRGEGVISHVMFFETENYPKILCLTDGGMIPFPTLEQKKEILKNAAMVMKRLGYDRIQAACICGAEVVNEKIKATTDARSLSQMQEEWDKWNMNVYGPVGLDMAISKESCAHKHYRAEGAGEADILLVPTYEVGNGIGKAMLYFAKAKNAGIIVGTKVPIILVSRSDSADAKLSSIALASIISESKR